MPATHCSPCGHEVGVEHCGGRDRRRVPHRRAGGVAGRGRGRKRTRAFAHLLEARWSTVSLGYSDDDTRQGAASSLVPWVSFVLTGSEVLLLLLVILDVGVLE